MSLKAMEQVTQAEETAKNRRSEAQLEAKRILVDAQRAGNEALIAVRSAAQQQSAQWLTQAEERAAQTAKTQQAENEKVCQLLRQTAQAKLTLAAGQIVERVVKR